MSDRSDFVQRRTHPTYCKVYGSATGSKFIYSVMKCEITDDEKLNVIQKLASKGYDFHINTNHEKFARSLQCICKDHIVSILRLAFDRDFSCKVYKEEGIAYMSLTNLCLKIGEEHEKFGEVAHELSRLGFA